MLVAAVRMAWEAFKVLQGLPLGQLGPNSCVEGGEAWAVGAFKAPGVNLGVLKLDCIVQPPGKEKKDPTPDILT